MATGQRSSASQLKPFGRRKTPPKVTISRGETEHSFYVRPWLSAFLGLSSIAAVGLTIGAGGYMLMHDDVVAVLSKRMGAIETTYEARVDTLRTQLDQAKSRSAVAEATLAQDVDTLLRRQMELSARHASVVRVVGMAQATNVVAEMPPLPPASQRAAVALTAFTAIDEAPLAARIAGAKETIDLIAAEQDAVVDTIADEADAFLGSLRSAIEDVPMPANLRSEFDGAGGPYVPLANGDDFASKTVRAELLLEAVQRVQSITDSMPLIAPTKGRRTSSFGSRIDPFNRTPAFHAGIDYAAPRGTPVKATAGGKVISAGRRGGYGIMVEIDHGGGLTTRYAHLSKAVVSPGER
ncbi:MAG: M23 family metallopeptidase, partial [Pseudomonadota bacterium]